MHREGVSSVLPCSFRWRTRERRRARVSRPQGVFGSRPGIVHSHPNHRLVPRGRSMRAWISGGNGTRCTKPDKKRTRETRGKKRCATLLFSRASDQPRRTAQHCPVVLRPDRTCGPALSGAPWGPPSAGWPHQSSPSPLFPPRARSRRALSFWLPSSDRLLPLSLASHDSSVLRSSLLASSRALTEKKLIIRSAHCNTSSERGYDSNGNLIAGWKDAG